MSLRNECPYSDKICPKVQDMEDRITVLEKNQIKMMRTVYYIAGIVSVSLGVTVMI